MGFDATFIPAIMLIIVGIGWMIVAFTNSGNQSSKSSNSTRFSNVRDIRSESKAERLLTARQHSPSYEELRLLAIDSDSQIRIAVARNPTTPGSILVQLARDANKSVRLQVARNSSTPREALEILAHDKDEAIRSAARFSE